MIWPLRALFNRPFDPVTTSSRELPPGRHENTISAWVPTSAGDFPAIPPIFSNSASEERDAEACKKLEPAVKTFADVCLYAGAFGSASKIKFINNLLVTVNTAAIGEAIALGLKAGVDPDIMIKAISGGSGGSVLFPIRAPRMVQKNFLPPQGTFEMLSHYFDYIGDLAYQSGAATPLFDVAVSLYERGIKNGLGEHDVAAIIEVINGIANEKSTGKSRAAAR